MHRSPIDGFVYVRACVRVYVCLSARVSLFDSLCENICVDVFVVVDFWRGWAGRGGGVWAGGGGWVVGLFFGGRGGGGGGGPESL